MGTGFSAPPGTCLGHPFAHRHSSSRCLSPRSPSPASLATVLLGQPSPALFQRVSCHFLNDPCRQSAAEDTQAWCPEEESWLKSQPRPEAAV